MQYSRRFSQNTKVLNLRGMRFSGADQMEGEIQQELDRFISPYLLGKGGKVKMVIIVGRGLNSRRKIDGKHPLRYYTENYLRSLGLIWRSGEYGNGGEGTLVVDFN